MPSVKASSVKSTSLGIIPADQDGVLVSAAVAAVSGAVLVSGSSCVGAEEPADSAGAGASPASSSAVLFSDCRSA
jgi:hypothetical protein